MGNTLTTAQFADLINPDMFAIFYEPFPESARVYDKLFAVKTSTKVDETVSEVSTFGTASTLSEGQNIPIDAVYQGYDYTFTHGMYGTGFSVTKWMQINDLHDIIRQLPASCKESMLRSVEIIATNVLNNGFSGSYTYGDAVALFSASHPGFTGTGVGNQSNLSTGALSYSTLKTALTAIRKRKGTRDEQIVVDPGKLVIPPDLEFTAYEIFKSPGDPGSTARVVNSVAGLYSGIQTIVNPYLSSTTAWFIGPKKPRQLMFFWRYRPDLEQNMDKSNRNIEYNSWMAFSCGAAGWREWQGSQGT